MLWLRRPCEQASSVGSHRLLGGRREQEGPRLQGSAALVTCQTGGSVKRVLGMARHCSPTGHSGLLGKDSPSFETLLGGPRDPL